MRGFFLVTRGTTANGPNTGFCFRRGAQDEFPQAEGSWRASARLSRSVSLCAHFLRAAGKKLIVAFCVAVKADPDASHRKQKAPGGVSAGPSRCVHALSPRGGQKNSLFAFCVAVKADPDARHRKQISIMYIRGQISRLGPLQNADLGASHWVFGKALEVAVQDPAAAAAKIVADINKHFGVEDASNAAKEFGEHISWSHQEECDFILRWHAKLGAQRRNGT